MSEQEPAVQTLEIADVRLRLAPLAAEVARKKIRVIVEESGAPVAALVSVDDLERWARLDREREDRFAVIDRMRAAFADVSTDEIEREVDKALAEVRVEPAHDLENNNNARSR